MMVLYITAFILKVELELYLAWEPITMVLLTMDSGKMMLGMDGEFTKIRLLAIDMRGNGRRIEKTDLEDRIQWIGHMRATM